MAQLSRTLTHGTLVVTDELNVVFANQAFAQLAGQTPMALAKGDPLPVFMDVGSLPALVKQALQHQHARGRSQLHFHAQALAIPVSITVHSLQQPDGHAQPRLLITVEDLRKQEQLNRDLLNAQEVATSVPGSHTLTASLPHASSGTYPWLASRPAFQIC
jgi:nitrogen-specific signal transduction histidine kinase